MNVSACLVTRGDVDMQPVIDSLPPSWEIVIWDNSGRITRSEGWAEACTDLSVYGRYAAIEYASHYLIYVQDDDVIVSDPQEIVDEWLKQDGAMADQEIEEWFDWPGVVANMPTEFRHSGYTDSCLVGFGACFHRNAPKRAFEKFLPGFVMGGVATDPSEINGLPERTKTFHRTCDVVFTTLTPRVLVDIPKTDREMASDSNRMWKQDGHLDERTRMLNLVRQVRDA